MGGWFSRTQAVSAKNNASTQVLKNALTKYIAAIKNVPNANQVRSIMNTNGNFINANGKALTKSYKNRIANGIATAAYKAKAAVQTAQQGNIPEGKAAEVVNNAAAKIKNLNTLINGLQGNNASRVRGYLLQVETQGRKINNNRATNASRIGGPRFTPFFNSINQVRLNNKMNHLTAKIMSNKRPNIPNSTKKAELYVQLYKENLNRNKATNKNGKYTRIWAEVEKLTAANQPVNMNAKARAAINKLWGFAGTGSNSNKNQAIANAIVAATTAKVRKDLNLNGLNRAQLNAILASNTFVPSSNQSGGNKNRHVTRVKKILNSLYAPTN
jgi:hypothetical protein